mgnify:CR=1 FL=1|tara:strand:+ start:4588 stop:6375 length:1788 start_codon:yes stop_codon:yes gene_type:complete
MRVYPVTDFLETEICFLAEVDLKGTIYRFSSFPVEIELDSGGVVFFPGLLGDPNFTQELQEIGQIKLSTNSISMSLVFPFNVAERQMLGNGIDNGVMKLSYVTIKRGVVQQTFEDIVHFFKGVIREPVYGHPNAEQGYVEFSVENEIYVNDTSILQAINGDLVSFDHFPFTTGHFQGAGDILDIETDWISSSVKFSLGKNIPAVIGSPGRTTLINGQTLDYPGTPAYKVGSLVDIGNPTLFFLLIAGHYCLANTVSLQDNDGNLVSSKTVFNSTGASGQIFAYAIFDQNELSFSNLIEDQKFQYYVRWTDGGGAISPYTGNTLEKGGDFLVWCLESLKIDFDRESFEAVRPILNEYIFAGYINDPSIKIYEFAQKYIIPFLPVTLSTGANGVYAIIDHRNTERFSSPRASITTDPTFERISPVTPRQSEIINDLVVKYASGFESTISFDNSAFGGGFSNKIGGSEMKGTIYIKAKRQTGIETPYEIVSPYCILSQQIYGVQSQTVEIDYVHDRDTAIKIGLDIIRRKSLPEKVCTYRAAFSFGFLSVGDVIELTDTDIGLSQAKVQIVGKTYDGASWLYDIMFQENPIDNQRVSQ